MKHNFFRVLAGLLLGVLSFISLSSCTKDDFSDENIIGKWQSTSITYQEYESGKLIRDESSKCVDVYLGLYFKSDGTGQWIRYGDGKSNTAQITWVIMDDKLTLSAENTLTYNIISLNGKSMTLEYVEEISSDGIKYKCISRIYFKKI